MRRFLGIMATSRKLRMIDIGANLTDPVFQGMYRGKQAHPSDLEDVLARARETGVEKIIITGGTLKDSEGALTMAKTTEQLYCTVGCHPTRCGEFEGTAGTSPEQYLEQLLTLVEENKSKVAAIGECGLDYDRLHFCDKPLQLKYFEKQFYLSEKTGLPLFLHCRNAFGDFIDIIERNRTRFSGGVVHSFTGTLPEAMCAIEHGLYIGINGCSLKTAENLEVVRAIPADKLMIETDAPWCEMRPTHASSKLIETSFPSKKKERWERGVAVKSRNEPRNILIRRKKIGVFLPYCPWQQFLGYDTLRI
ncbi:deoxyribonuclease TATDN1-like isoform X2 [Halichondria panicea]|uniref:deoxyribonuclease TATDN1-like isoform X2 n=1 Tax=Halichondria panicea TaxID=6063 RepID=UPI00312BC113